ncbi:MAG: MFS transporter, partial [Neisseriaceae bacterium]|nr:MFS transporter [Neisseriaceae bacterium]
VEVLPRFLAMPICGILCDKSSPAFLLRVSQIARVSVCILGMIGYYLWGGMVWLIALSGIAGVLTAQGTMAREMIVLHYFSRYGYEKSTSYVQVSDQLGMIIAPLMTGFLLTLMTWTWLVWLIATLFLFADACVNFWQKKGGGLTFTPIKNEEAWWTPFQQAMKHIWYLPNLKGLIALASVINFIYGFSKASSAAIVTGLQGLSPQSYSDFLALTASGTIFILLINTRMRVSTRHLLIGSYGFIMLGSFLLGKMSLHWLYALGYFLIMGFDSLFSVSIRAYRRKIIPAADFGKTTGLIVMLNNLSQPLAGMMIAVFGARFSLSQLATVLPLLMLLVGGGVWFFRKTNLAQS